jgi:hypothetical protein
MKTCKQCLNIKEDFEFYFRKESNKYRQICKICYKAYNSKHYKNNTTNIKIKTKQYKELHRAEYKKYYRNYMRTRLSTDINFKLLHNYRKRVWEACIGIDKDQNTIDLIGCNSDEFRKHLESKFKPEMNWSNYGKNGWHVDHIIPCSRFDMSDKEQKKKALHFTNTQPLWWWENLSKGDKI